MPKSPSSSQRLSRPTWPSAAHARGRVLGCALAFGGSLGLSMGAAGMALAAEPAAAPTSAPAPGSMPPLLVELSRLQGEIARLAQEQREQRALIFQLMQADQQRYDLLLKFLQSGGAGSLGTPPPLPSLSAPAAPSPSGAAVAAASVAGASPTGAAGDAPRDASSRAAKVTGRVQFEGGPSEAYVYLEGLRASPRGVAPTVEIRQKDKQFQPRVSVVPLGARVFFPNEDTVVHNVFSTIGEPSFDLGNVKMGERPAPVVMSKPGPVEVFCNIHAKMKADILVVPNGHWAKVNADGTFEIADVPVGARKLVLWGPGLRSMTERVDVTPKGATVSFQIGKAGNKPHLNKLGQAYGSYGE